MAAKKIVKRKSAEDTVLECAQKILDDRRSSPVFIEEMRAAAASYPKVMIDGLKEIQAEARGAVMLLDLIMTEVAKRGVYEVEIADLLQACEMVHSKLSWATGHFAGFHQYVIEQVQTYISEARRQRGLW